MHTQITTPTLRHDWQLDEILALFEQPFTELIWEAQHALRQHFNPIHIQLSTLLNIKTGACGEDCAYCSQSIRYKTAIDVEPMLDLQQVIAAAKTAKASGATRFCMGAAGRSPKQQELHAVVAMITAVKALGLETCVTLGMLDAEQTQTLKQAGLDYYNHNLDTSADYYTSVITTRTYQDRLDTLTHLRAAGIKVCCGGIIGMGESRRDRAGLLQTLANLPQHPESVPINQLIPIAGTPLAEAATPDTFEFIRCIAVARILLPASYVRLSAGRTGMNDELQALCFLAGANSIFYGEKLLTAENPDTHHDKQLLERLGLQAQA